MVKISVLIPILLIIFLINITQCQICTVYLTPNSNSSSSQGNTTKCDSIEQACTNLIEAINSCNKSQEILVMIGNGTYSGIGNFGLELYGYNIKLNGTGTVVFDLSNATGQFISILDANITPNNQTTNLEIINLQFISANLSTLNGSVINILTSGGDSLSNIHIENSTFVNNTALNGGVISFVAATGANYNNNLTMENVNFTSNYAVTNGGSINSQYNTYIKCNACYFVGNNAGGFGSAVVSSGYGFDASFSQFSRNQANKAVVYIVYQRLYTSSFDNCQVDYNIGLSGNISSVFIIFESHVVFNHTIFNNNKLTSIYSVSITATSAIIVDNCSFNDNSIVNSVASAIRADQGSIFKIYQTSFSGNECLMGGAIFSRLSNSISIYNSSFIDNYAVEFGGAIYSNSSNLINISDSKFIDNKASKSGSSIYCVESLINYQDTNIIPSMYSCSNGCEIQSGKSLINQCADPNDSKDKPRKFTPGKIAALVIGIIIGLALVGFLIYFIRNKLKHQSYQQIA